MNRDFRKTNLFLLISLSLLIAACVADYPELPNTTPFVQIDEDFLKVRVNTPIQIIAFSSDRESGELNIEWNIIDGPEGNSGRVVKDDDEYTFETNLPGLYIIEAYVSDGQLDNEDIITIAVSGVIDEDINTRTEFTNVFVTDTLVDYYITNSITVNGGIHISDRVSFEVEKDVEIIIENNGFIRALGRQNNEITFRGSENIAGYWRGFTLRSNSDKLNILEHVKIFDSGSILGEGASLFVDGSLNSSLILTDCLLENSEQYGIILSNNLDILDFSNNTFSYNTKAPIKISAELLYNLDNSNTFRNNNEDFIEVMALNDINSISKTGELVNAGIPYYFFEDLEINGELTINAGTRLRFDLGTLLRVPPEGRLLIKGFRSNSVIIEGIVPGLGTWGGIEIESSELNVFNYAIIRNGGGFEHRLGRSNIYLKSENDISVLSLNNSRIESSLGYGIITEVGAFLSEDNNVFAENTEGRILKE